MIESLFTLQNVGLTLAFVGTIPFIVSMVVFFTSLKEAARSEIFFLFLGFSVMCWISGMGLFQYLELERVGFVFLQISNVGAMLSCLALVYFALTFESRKALTPFLAIGLAAPIVWVIFEISIGGTVTPAPEKAATFSRDYSVSLFFWVSSFVSAVYVGLGFYIFWEYLLKSAGIFRQKSKLAFVSILISGVAAVGTNAFLPTIGILDYFYIGRTIAAFGVAYVGYLIISYRLFDTRLFLTRVFVVFIIYALGANIFFAEEIRDFIIKATLFVLSSGMSYLLLSTVKNEIRSVERIQGLLRQSSNKNLDLEDMNERNSAFITATANQLRDPLSGIRWQSASILSGVYGDISERAQPYVQRIFESSKALITIVDEFLDLRKIEQNAMEFNFSKIDLASVVGNVLEDIQPRAKEKSLELSFENDGRASYEISGDESKLRQVVTILIDNAVKYTPAGAITAELSKSTSEDHVIVKVCDNGPGLSRDEKKALFKKFSRTKSAKKSEASGTGLGLFLAAQIIEGHGGKIWVSSPGKGKGSTFTFKVPVNQKHKNTRAMSELGAAEDE